MRWLAKFIYFKLLGWQVVGNTSFSKDTIKKAIIIAAPHTSWYDFHMGILLRSVSNLKTNFVGKKELFVFPIGWFFRILGGAPIINYLLGIYNYSKKKFLFYVSLAEILFVTIFSTIGYLFSDMWEILSLLLEDISYAITLLILLGIIVGITYYKNNDSEK